MNRENFKEIKEFTKEELLEQFNKNEIDIDFICAYTEKRDKVYNKLIAYNNVLEQALNEIKEYCNNGFNMYSIDKYRNDLFVKRKDILQIIDKYLGGSENENNENN